MEIRREDIVVLNIDCDADIGLCRRNSVSVASKIGFNDIMTGEVAILVSELVTNVLKHGGGKGKLIASNISDNNGRKGLEIICCDDGPGITDLDLALNDGYTKTQTLGIGLGTIRRFSDVFEIASAINPELKISELGMRNNAHCLRIIKWVPENRVIGINCKLITGVYSRCKSGEILNGDSSLIVQSGPDKTIAAVIDGLGHGKEANIASNIIKEQILRKTNLSPEELILSAHESAKGTRGAVIGLILIDTSKSILLFTGVGNIEGFIVTSAEKRNLISYGGILGQNIRIPRTFEFAFTPGDTVCLYSDGIHSRWNSNDIDWKKLPQNNAEFIGNQYSRPGDDTTVLIINYIN